MGWLRDIFKYRDERHELIQRRLDRDEIERHYTEAIAGTNPRDDEHHTLVAEFFHEMDTINAAIAELETAQIKRRAAKWRIPIPKRPYKDDDADDFWEWHYVHGVAYISLKGMSQLRKEIYQEWEMWWKPWLTWVALGLSILSLVFAALKP